MSNLNWTTFLSFSAAKADQRSNSLTWSSLWTYLFPLNCWTVSVRFLKIWINKVFQQARSSPDHVAWIMTWMFTLQLFAQRQSTVLHLVECCKVLKLCYSLVLVFGYSCYHFIYKISLKASNFFSSSKAFTVFIKDHRFCVKLTLMLLQNECVTVKNLPYRVIASCRFPGGRNTSRCVHRGRSLACANSRCEQMKWRESRARGLQRRSREKRS